MNNLEQNLQAYLQQVQKILEEKREAISERDLQEVVLNLGLSDKDIAWIEGQFQGYFERGKGYVNYKQSGKGITELQQALKLKPFHAETLYWIALAYFQIWQKKGKKKDKIQAQKYADLCLKADYKQQKALDLIYQLNKKSKHWRKKQASFLRLIWTLVAVFGVLTVITLILLYYWKVNQSQKEEPKPEIVQPEKEIIREKDITDIPTQLVKEEKSLNLRLETQSSFIKKNDSEHFYELKTCLLNDNIEITRLIINLELLNKNQVSIFQENIELLNETLPEMRPKDALAFTKKINLRNDVVQAKIKIVEIEEQAIEDYDLSKKLTFEENEEDKTYNSDLQFELRERYQTIITSAESFTHTIAFEFENVGKENINSVKIEINWFNEEDFPIHTEEVILLQEDDPSLIPNQRRVKQQSFTVNFKHQNFLKYKINILRLE